MDPSVPMRALRIGSLAARRSPFARDRSHAWLPLLAAPPGVTTARRIDGARAGHAVTGDRATSVDSK
jgi:hypothetical protein